MNGSPFKQASYINGCIIEKLNANDEVFNVRGFDTKLSPEETVSTQVLYNPSNNNNNTLVQFIYE